MSKASSRGKNNSKGMERARRSQGGAQSAALGLAKAQWWGRGSCSPCVLAPVPSTTGQRNVLGSETSPSHEVWCPPGATGRHSISGGGRGFLGHARGTSSSWGTRKTQTEPQISASGISWCFLSNSVFPIAFQPLGRLWKHLTAWERMAVAWR